MDARDVLLRIIYMIAQDQIAWDMKERIGDVLNTQ